MSSATWRTRPEVSTGGLSGRCERAKKGRHSAGLLRILDAYFFSSFFISPPAAGAAAGASAGGGAGAGAGVAAAGGGAGAGAGFSQPASIATDATDNEASNSFFM